MLPETRCARRGDVRVATRTLRDLVAGAELSFTEHGTHRPEGVPDEWAVFRADG